MNPSRVVSKAELTSHCLRAGFRPRQQRHRSLHRALAEKAGPARQLEAHPHRARPRVSVRRRAFAVGLGWRLGAANTAAADHGTGLERLPGCRRLDPGSLVQGSRSRWRGRAVARRGLRPVGCRWRARRRPRVGSRAWRAASKPTELRLVRLSRKQQRHDDLAFAFHRFERQPSLGTVASRQATGARRTILWLRRAPRRRARLDSCWPTR